MKELSFLQLDYFPSISFNMLIEWLDEFNVVYEPTKSRRVFRWFEIPSISKQIGEQARPKGLRSGQILHAGKLDDAREALEADPNIFACAIMSEHESLPSWVTDFAERVVVIQPTDSFMYVAYLIECLFMNMAIWESRLHLVSSQPEGLGEILASSEAVIQQFIICYDESDQVLAFTPNIVPPNDQMKQAVSTGHITQNPGGNTSTKKSHFKPSDSSKDATQDALTVRIPITVDGLRFATLEVVSNTPLTKGTHDLVELLSKYVKQSCRVLWHDQVKSTNPYHFFFSRLIQGVPCSYEDIALQLDAIGIPANPQLKLLLFDISAVDNLGLSFAELGAVVKHINHGNCYYFAYQGYLCLLCYDVAGDNQLSNKRSVEDVRHFVAEPYGIPASASQIFENITDLDLAYRQALIAHNLRAIVEAEDDNSYDKRQDSEKQIPELIPFEACLLYYLVGAPEKDERFLAFIFSHTLMQKISLEDKMNGTNNLEIFWEYLSSERNASIVAERLHVHRNTVRYRIDKLEKRFDLDLSSPQVREKMILDFKMFFLMQNRSSIRQLFQ